MLLRWLRNVPFTVTAICEKVISNGEGPHRWANHFLHVVDLAEHCRSLERPVVQRVQDDVIWEWRREVNRVAAD